MLDKSVNETTKGLSENLTGGGSFRRDVSEATAHAETRPVVAHVALYLCMVIALAMTMLFAMPNGVLADEAGTDGIETATEQPVEDGEPAPAEPDSTATTEENAEPVEGADNGETGAQEGEGSTEGEPVTDGAETDAPLLTDAVLGGIELYATEDADMVVDPDTTNNWNNFTAPDGVTSTQNVGRIWTDKSVFDTLSLIHISEPTRH